MSDATTKATGRGWRIATIVISVVVALLVGGIVGYLLAPKASTGSSALPDIGKPTIVDRATLSKIAEYVGPIYWNGPDDATKYEVTVTAGGSVFVRYLPKDVDAGSKDKYLTVATYRSTDDLSKLLASDSGAKRVTGSNGAIIVTTDKAPDSAYFSFPDSNFQVEVFSPESGQATQLVESGHVELVP